MNKTLVCIANRIADGVELAVRAEASGFDAIWATEFYNRDAFSWMTAMGVATQKIQIGSGIAYAFARPPVLVAAAAADVDEVTGGRVLLGLGTGTDRMNREWYGLDWHAPVPKISEAVQVIRKAWSSAGGPSFHHEGEFWKLDIQNYFRPGLVREQIPIYVAGVNRGMARAAGRIADGYIGHPLASRRFIREVTLPAVEEGLAGAERKRSDFDVANYLICSVHSDPDVARREVALQVAFHATVSVYRTIFSLHDYDDASDAIRAAFMKLDIETMVENVPDEMIEECGIYGTPEQCRERLEAYEGLIDTVMFFAPSFAVHPKRVLENQHSMLDVFAR